MPHKSNYRQVGGDHYTLSAFPCPNCGEAIQHWDMSWALQFDQFQYCITKYVQRHRWKNGLEDLKKAQHHLEKYIELLEQAEPAVHADHD